jgi:hypothetical protein
LEELQNAAQIYRVATWIGTTAIFISYVAAYVLARRLREGDRKMAPKYPFALRFSASLFRAKQGRIEPVDRPHFEKKRRNTKLILSLLFGAVLFNIFVRHWAQQNFEKVRREAPQQY